MGSILLFAALLLGHSLVLGDAAPTFSVATIDGRTVSGPLVELTGEQLALKTDDDAKATLKLIEIRVLRSDAASFKPGANPTDVEASAAADVAKRAEVWIETIDGSRIPALSYQAAKGVGRLKLLSGDQTLSIPTRAIKQVEFRGSGDSPTNWTAPDRTDTASDLLVVRKREGVDYVEGAVGDVTDASVTLSIDGDATPVKLAKVAGIVYYHADSAAPLPTAACVLQDLAGWKLLATSVKLDGANLDVTTTFGGKLQFPVKALKSLDFSAAVMTYLSAMEQESAQTTLGLDFGKTAPAVRAFYQPSLDHGFDGAPLTLAQNEYPKGLMLPSGSRLVFKVTGKGKRFKALAGIDDSVRPSGNVVLKIVGDGKSLLEARLTGRDAPQAIDLDVSAVRRLSIVVEPGTGLDVGNYLDLCDARIVK